MEGLDEDIWQTQGPHSSRERKNNRNLFNIEQVAVYWPHLAFFTPEKILGAGSLIFPLNSLLLHE